jgi:hypothetical protein
MQYIITAAIEFPNPSWIRLQYGLVIGKRDLDE